MENENLPETPAMRPPNQEPEPNGIGRRAGRKLLMFRQGDILLAEVRRMPRNASPFVDQEAARILALGEQTGHKHRITGGTVYMAGPSNARRRVVVLDQPAELVHEEHGPIQVPAGTFEVVQQRTYVPPLETETRDGSRVSSTSRPVSD